VWHGSQMWLWSWCTPGRPTQLGQRRYDESADCLPVFFAILYVTLVHGRQVDRIVKARRCERRQNVGVSERYLTSTLTLTSTCCSSRFKHTRCFCLAGLLLVRSDPQKRTVWVLEQMFYRPDSRPHVTRPTEQWRKQAPEYLIDCVSTVSAAGSRVSRRRLRSTAAKNKNQLRWAWFLFWSSRLEQFVFRSSDVCDATDTNTFKTVVKIDFLWWSAFLHHNCQLISNQRYLISKI